MMNYHDFLYAVYLVQIFVIIDGLSAFLSAIFVLLVALASAGQLLILLEIDDVFIGCLLEIKSKFRLLLFLLDEG
jgi:hypothetical protein